MHATSGLNDRPDQTREGTGVPDQGAVLLLWRSGKERLVPRATYQLLGDEYQVTGFVRSDRVQPLPRCGRREDEDHVQLWRAKADASRGNDANAGVAGRTGNLGIRAGAAFPPNPFAEDRTEASLIHPVRQLWRDGHYWDAALLWVCAKFR